MKGAGIAPVGSEDGSGHDGAPNSESGQAGGTAGEQPALGKRDYNIRTGRGRETYAGQRNTLL
jgi:hypothetical protein